MTNKTTFYSLLILVVVLFCRHSAAALPTEEDIIKIAAFCNEKFQGERLSDLLTGESCTSEGRIVVHSYQADWQWIAPDNLKNDIINELKLSNAHWYFSNNISLRYIYRQNEKNIKKLKFLLMN